MLLLLLLLVLFLLEFSANRAELLLLRLALLKLLLLPPRPLEDNADLLVTLNCCCWPALKRTAFTSESSSAFWGKGAVKELLCCCGCCSGLEDLATWRGFRFEGLPLLVKVFITDLGCLCSCETLNLRADMLADVGRHLFEDKLF